MPTYSRGIVYTVSGWTNFQYQSKNVTKNAEEAKVTSSLGNTIESDFYDKSTDVEIEAIVPATAAMPAVGSQVILADGLKYLVQPGVRKGETNTGYKSFTMTLKRYVDGAYPAYATPTPTPATEP